MPIFKIVATQEIRQTFTLYVDAPTAEKAISYAACLEDLDGVQGVVKDDEEDMGGEIKSTELVENTPTNIKALTPAWSGVRAVVKDPAHATPASPAM
ncbi:hypothetical protein [Nitrospirillum amazonense]|uniref:hypothetical protein n=1 Tax=Nitrospirillum amazonense TaxID=28077 RepID=UPI0024129E6E|nr:hypothetical protein [Nitrospirillum amazonense]MDG3444630.1 hypothetical protein [Nitrospirillum amazonense]